MNYRRLGRTGLNVSAISLGTVEIGMEYGIPVAGQPSRPSEADAARLLHSALDAGVNYIDTARAYGESEAIIGRALRHRRPEYILASKVLAYADEPSPGQLRELVAASVEESLRQLQTDVIDVMMIHSATAQVIHRGELVAILQDLRRRGCFRFIGASVYGEEAALAAVTSGAFDCLQIAYSVLDRRPEASLMPTAEAGDVGLVIRSVLLKGALTHRYRLLPAALANLKKHVEEMNRLAEEMNVTLPELAYRYVLSHPMAQTALVGASAVHELTQALAFAQAGPLPDPVLRQLRHLSMPDAADLNPGNWPAF